MMDDVSLEHIVAPTRNLAAAHLLIGSGDVPAQVGMEKAMSLDAYKFVNRTPYDATPYGLGEDGMRDAAKEDKAPLPPGSYSDLSLMPPYGPECCDEVRRLSCVCAGAWKCPVHGEWHFASHD